MLTENKKISRLRIKIQGAVQGVGFRPFVYKLARVFQLKGWVSNSSQGVVIEAEGEKEILKDFLISLEKEKPELARIQEFESDILEPAGYDDFEIRESSDSGEKSALVLPDIAVCADCLKDILNPRDRRYYYPFTNCVNCGPRYSILEKLPYDRENTTMKRFRICKKCLEEYQDPSNRRFHAQPTACPDCGPTLKFCDRNGKIMRKGDEALFFAAQKVSDGFILAVKGLGGFHLVVDARNTEAVNLLRERKHRKEKPFAVMVPSMEWVRKLVQVSKLEEKKLLSPEAPIVLLRRLSQNLEDVSSAVAPANPYLGIMLPYTPLHYLFLKELTFPIVATSGNLSEEPICVDETEAFFRLGGTADYFLIHDRPIARPVDDSVVRILWDQIMILRRSRGYAPFPIRVDETLPAIIGVGGHLKNAVSISCGKKVFISQHIGDLGNVQGFEVLKKTIQDLSRIYDLKPAVIACDLHPDYRSTHYAEELAEKEGAQLVRVQHHYAHSLSGMTENRLKPPFLSVAWDGTGYGEDGTVWGGEFLKITDDSFKRVAHLRLFPLPGGEKAVTKPKRAGFGLIYELFKGRLDEVSDLEFWKLFSSQEIKILKTMLEKKINSPLTSSAGRLFDAAAAITGVCFDASFEGQAAVKLEFAAYGSGRLAEKEKYPFRLVGTGSEAWMPIALDWEPMVFEMLKEIKRKVSISMISVKFHNTLSDMIVSAAHQIGLKQILLTGGCFQNKYLVERTAANLKSEGFELYLHHQIPPNDGGIALGQVMAASRVFRDQPRF